MGPAVYLALLLCVGPSVSEDVAAGEKAWAEERWDDASAAFARAFAETGDPTFLYTRAQAERKAGRCETAVELYDEFIEKSDSDEAKSAARENADACRSELEPEPPPPELPPPNLDPPAPAPTPDPIQPPRPWHRDPWGGALVGVGLAASVVGGVLIGVAYRTANDADGEGDDRAFGQELQRAGRLERGGAITLGIGGALLVAGIVRWAIVANRGPKSSAALVRTLPSLRLRLSPIRTR